MKHWMTDACAIVCMLNGKNAKPSNFFLTSAALNVHH